MIDVPTVTAFVGLGLLWHAYGRTPKAAVDEVARDQERSLRDANRLIFK